MTNTKYCKTSNLRLLIYRENYIKYNIILTEVSNVANVIKRRNNSLPDAMAVTGFSVDLIASIAFCKQYLSS